MRLKAGQRVRVSRPDCVLNGRVGFVAVIRQPLPPLHRVDTSAVDRRVWVNMDSRLPPEWQGFDLNDRFGRQNWVLLDPADFELLPEGKPE